MFGRRIAAASLLLALASAGSTPSTAAPAPEGNVLEAFLKDVKRTVLPNGLTVITRQAAGTGVVAINTWVKAGYFNEPDEVAGMAHLFEHMFFKGSKGFPGAEEIARELSLVGGQTNAGTIYDSTNYYFVVPKEGFRRGLEIQADAIANPLFDAKELKKEAEVVIEESNRKFDNPPAVSLERMFATAFTRHRMKRWRIGSNEVLRGIERDNLRAFFETLYRPDNIILTIAGDVTHEEALKAVRATFGTIPKGTLKKERGPVEPPQTEFRFGQSSADLKQGYSVLGWHTPGAGDTDEITLDLLASILGEGRSSRLYTAAIAEEAASTIAAAHFTFDDVGMLVIDASFDEKNRAEVETRALREVARMQSHGPTDYEVRLAKNRLQSAQVFGLQGVLGQAQSLAQAEARHGYKSLATRLAAMEVVTGAQVKAAARKYLTLSNLTLYHYRPKGAAETTAEAALAFARTASAGESAAIPGLPIPTAPLPVRGAAAGREATQTTLANGATLIVHERMGAPVVSTGFYLRGGCAEENSANAGITRLMAHVLRKGTSRRSGEALARDIEFLGTELSIDVDSDYFGLTFDILRGNYRAGIDLLADVVLNPIFPAEGLAEERHLQMGSIKRAYDSSTQRPLRLAYRDLWGAHPYALPIDGTLESLPSLDTAALRAWWERTVNARRAVIVVVGDIATDDARRIVETAFAGLSSKETPTAPLPALTVPTARIETVEFRDRRQSAIAVLFPTVPASHPDWPRIRLLGNVTSGLAGTFFAELRGRRSLAYTVFAGDASRKDAGVFLAYMATDAAKEGEAKEALVAEIRRLQSDGMTAKDVERARKSFAGSTRISLQTNGALLNDYAGNILYGLGLDATQKLLKQTESISLEDLKATAAKYLSTDNYVTAVLRGRSG